MTQHTSQPERAELGLSEDIARAQSRPEVKAAGKAAKLGDQEPLYLAAAALAGAGLLLRNPKMVWAGLRVGAAVALSDLTKSGIKRLVTRSRPRTVIEGKGYRSDLGGSEDKDDQSFPSGHTAATVAAARALAHSYGWAAPLGAAASLGIAGTRVAGGDHWPSDVAAGAVVGLISAGVSGAALDRLERAVPPRYRPPA